MNQHNENDDALSPPRLNSQKDIVPATASAIAANGGGQQDPHNFIKVKLGGNTYHVHISEQERRARRDAKQRAATLHKETVRRKRNLEQKKLTHEQKEEQHRQQVLAARRAQLMLQTQRYLRATSRRPIPPQYPRNKTLASPRPLTAVQYPSGSRSARNDNGEVDTVLRAMNDQMQQPVTEHQQSSRARRGTSFGGSRGRPTTSQTGRGAKASTALNGQASGAYTITQVHPNEAPTEPVARKPRVQSARVYSAFEKHTQDDIRQAAQLKHQSMRNAIDKFNQELLNVIHQPGSGDSNSSVEQQVSVAEGPRRKTWATPAQQASGDSQEDGDTFRKDAAAFPEKLHRIEPPHIEPQVVMRAHIKSDTREMLPPRNERFESANMRDRHVISPVDKFPPNPLYTPQPPSTSLRPDPPKRPIEEPSPPKYESVFEITKPAPARPLNESVAPASSVSSILSVDDDSESSSTLVTERYNTLRPKSILRSKSAGNLRTPGGGKVTDSIDVARSRAKSAGVNKKSVRWKQIEYQDGTVRPFPQDIDELRQRTKAALYQPQPPKVALATVQNQPIPPRSSSAPVTRTKKIIQDAQKTGYVQQHVARRQFQRLQNGKKMPKAAVQRGSRPSSAMSDHDRGHDRGLDRDRLAMTRDLENRRTPTDQEITQLWRTVKHVIGQENEAPSSGGGRYVYNAPQPQTPTRSSVRMNNPQQMSQSYYLPRPPVSNAPSTNFVPNGQNGFRNSGVGGGVHTQRLNRPKVHNLSSLSLEEKRLVQSLDRLNSRLNEIEVSVKKD